MFSRARLERSTETLNQLRSALARFQRGLREHDEALRRLTELAQWAPTAQPIASALEQKSSDALVACCEMDTALALVCADLETLVREAA